MLKFIVFNFGFIKEHLISRCNKTSSSNLIIKEYLREHKDEHRYFRNEQKFTYYFRATKAHTFLDLLKYE